MSSMVFKYPIPVTDSFTLDLPEGARPLTVQMQGSQPCLWALIDPSRPKTLRVFRLAGTGHPIEDPGALSFIATFQMSNGMLVFHVFEQLEN